MSIKKSNIRAHIVIDRAFKAELELWAQQDNRSFSNFVVKVLQDYAKERRKKEKSKH